MTSLTVYGIAFTILLVFNIFQWRRNQQLTDMILEANDRYQQSAVDFIVVVRETLESVKEIKDRLLTKFIAHDEKS
jgi:hypothetical protein